MTDDENPLEHPNDSTTSEQQAHADMPGLLSRLLDLDLAPTQILEAIQQLEREPPPPATIDAKQYGDKLADKLIRGAGSNDQRAMAAGYLIAISLHRLANKLDS